MKIVLYELDIATVKSTILLKKKDNKYIIDGYDRGKVVKEVLGGYSYEYSMSFNEVELEKLKNNKKIDSKSFLENWIKQFIDDPKCFSNIKVQLDKYGVEYGYFSWRDGN